MFQEYKRQTDELKVVFVDNLELPFTINTMEFNINEKEKYNRTEKKREGQKIINEYYNNLEK